MMIPFLFVLAAGCVDDDLSEGAPVPVEEVALCAVPPNPPPADASVVLTPADDSDKLTAVGYGATECSHYTFGFVNAQVITVYPYPLPPWEEPCEERTLRARFYSRHGLAWFFRGEQVVRGEWGGPSVGCLLSARVDAPGADELRAYAQVSKRSCAPNGLCGTDYGVSMRAYGWMSP